jgi:Fur family peroxide stress response transcriptional regulator
MKTEDAEVARRLEQFKAAVREAGVKLTHQRLEIFHAVAASHDHPSAEAVYRAVQATTPTVSLDTVYRTLWLLTDLGLLSTLGPRQGSVRFDANVESHHHYVCTRCGLVRDFDSEDLHALKIPDTVKEFGQVVSAHVEVRGICEPCAKNSPGSQTPGQHNPPRDENRSNS